MGLKLKLEYEAPKPVNTSAVRLKILTALNRFGRLIKRDFETTTVNFDHDVNFTIQKRFGTRVASIEVGTDDRVYEWLNNGTPVRYNVMTSDFVPKTQPGTLSTGPGKGGFSHVDYKHPRPGIQARGWTDIIADRNEDFFVAEITEAILEGVGL